MCKVYNMTELSKILDVPLSTLRYYQRNELIAPHYINKENGYYYYSPDIIETLDKLTFLRSLQLPIKEIKRIMINRMTEEEVIALLEEHRKHLTEEIRMLSSAEARINEIISIRKRNVKGQLPFRKFCVQTFPERQILYKRCSPYQFSDGGEWLISFSNAVNRKNAMDIMPGALSAMGGISSLKKYDSLQKMIFTKSFLLMEPCQPFDDWQEESLPAGDYLLYRFDNSQDTHDSGYAALIDHIHKNGLETDDALIEMLTEGVIPVFHASIPIELQVRLL